MTYAAWLTGKGGSALDKRCALQPIASILEKRNIMIVPGPGLRCLGPGTVFKTVTKRRALRLYCVSDSFKMTFLFMPQDL